MNWFSQTKKDDFLLSLTLGLSGFFLFSPLFGADFYKWTDEKGSVHFSGSIEDVPEKYRAQARGGTFDQKAGEQKSGKEGPDVPRAYTTPGIEPAQKPEPFKRYTVPYTSYEGTTSRLIIEVTFNGRITVPMILDTGAGEVIISETLAKQLGLFDREQAKLDVSVSGFGGTAPAIRTILDSMEIGEIKNVFVPTRIVPTLSEAFYGVVGMNFMSHYQVRINPLETVVVFEEIRADVPHFGGHDERWWRQYFAEFSAYRDQLKQRVTALEQYLRENKLAYKSVRDAVKTELAYSETQYREAEKLLEQLTRYASLNGVPISWRRFNH